MGVSVLRGQGVGLPTVKVSFWPGVRNGRNFGYVAVTEQFRYYLRYTPVQGDYKSISTATNKRQ